MPLRTTASSKTESAQGERGGHDLQEMTAIDTIQLRCSLRKLAFELSLEARGGGKLIKAAPVFRTGELTFGRSRMFEFAFHRWQPVQLCGGLIFQSCTNFSPAATPDFAAMVSEFKL